MPEFRREAVGQLRDLLAEANPCTQVALGNASGLTVRGGKAWREGRKSSWQGIEMRGAHGQPPCRKTALCRASRLTVHEGCSDRMLTWDEAAI